MDDPTMATLVHSLYVVAVQLRVEDFSGYNIIREGFMRWMYAFESFEEIAESVDARFFWLSKCRYGWPLHTVVTPWRTRYLL
jgi:hypothetical protein